MSYGRVSRKTLSFTTFTLFCQRGPLIFSPGEGKLFSMSGKDFELKLISEKDIFEQLQFSAGSTLFLGKYTLKEIFLLMERLNLVKKANKFGFES